VDPRLDVVPCRLRNPCGGVGIPSSGGGGGVKGQTNGGTMTRNLNIILIAILLL